MNFLQEYFRSPGGSLRMGPLVGVAIIVIGTAAALWWLASPRWQLLFGNLRESDAAEIAGSLGEWKVDYRYTADGTGIEVREGAVYDTRMKLVSAGVPSGGHVGFELFDDADFGATEFAQRVNFQRALQGEVERTLSAMPGVASVRVHLTIRKPGLFVGEQESSKASVAVTTAPGVSLEPDQVRGIRNLVAAAVDGLAADSVVVLGPGGQLIAGGSNDGDQARGQQQGDYEQRVRERVQTLLRGVFGLADFTVSVDARMNFDQVREVSETLLADGAGGHGLLVRKQTTRPVAGPEGAVAGTAQENVEYAHGSRREEIARATGRVERLSVAVLVPPGLEKDEMARLRELIAAAAGLDSGRGDTLEIDTLREPMPDAEYGADTVLADGMPGRLEPPAVAEVTSKTTGLSPGILWVGGGGLLMLGLLLGWWAHPRPRRLSAQELDAMAGRLRGWLAEGNTPA